MKGARTYPRTSKRQHLDFKVNKRLGGTYGVPARCKCCRSRATACSGSWTNRVRVQQRLRHRPAAEQPAAAGRAVLADPVQPRRPVTDQARRLHRAREQDLRSGPRRLAASRRGAHAGDVRPRNITPNLHALVEEFVLMDRFFADSEKSEPGHQWTHRGDRHRLRREDLDLDGLQRPAERHRRAGSGQPGLRAAGRHAGGRVLVRQLLQPRRQLPQLR